MIKIVEKDKTGYTVTVHGRSMFDLEYNLKTLHMAVSRYCQEERGLCPIMDLEMSVRTTNCLKNLGIKRIGDLEKHSREAIKNSPNFGARSLKELEDVMESMGIRFKVGV